MSAKRNVTAGLLGLGKVGKNVLLQYSREDHHFRISWVADSKRILTKRQRTPFSKTEAEKILEIRDVAKEQSQEREYEKRIYGCRVHSFEDHATEISIIHELMSETLQTTIILDATSSGAHENYGVAKNVMGCLAYCTGNKMPWADYELCSLLYREARRRATLLGLNCTLGVWVDQMEVLPILTRALKSGSVEFLKRDNSSFNFFFAKVGSGMAVDRAIAQIGASGHLEKIGPDALLTEVKDQTLKARIAANICAVMRGKAPPIERKSASKIRSPPTPDSVDPVEVARWHLEGRKRGKYPALVSEVNVNATSPRWEVGFRELPFGHPLARDFPGRCAIFARPTQDAKFTWSGDRSRKPSKGFAYSGYGGAVRTAAKLLWEAERAISLSQLSLGEECFPLPVLCSLAAGRREAIVLQRRLARSLA